MQTRNASASSFDSPFKGSPETTKIPSFAAYRNKGGETGPKVFQYFMVGTMGALSALGAKATVQGRSPSIALDWPGKRNRSEDKEGGVSELETSNWLFWG